jgi:hypothetical protein
MIDAPLRSATRRSAAQCNASQRAASQLNSTLRLSRCLGAGMAGKLSNHAVRLVATRRIAPPREASRRRATRRNSTLTLKGNHTCKPQ